MLGGSRIQCVLCLGGILLAEEYQLEQRSSLTHDPSLSSALCDHGADLGIIINLISNLNNNWTSNTWIVFSCPCYLSRATYCLGHINIQTNVMPFTCFRIWAITCILWTLSKKTYCHRRQPHNTPIPRIFRPTRHGVHARNLLHAATVIDCW